MTGLVANNQSCVAFLVYFRVDSEGADLGKGGDLDSVVMCLLKNNKR